LVLAHAGHEVAVWAREPRVADQINTMHQNRAYHPGVELPTSVSAKTNAADALRGVDIVVAVLPAQDLRANLGDWGGDIPRGAMVISLIKGIELGTTLRMSQVIEQATSIDESRIAALSGPNLASEIIIGQPSATTIACVDEQSARFLQQACSNNYFRPYWTTDVVGTEIGGAVKNVIALANGIAVGMGLGENSQASLMTRGLAEMARLGVALGADPLTFQGLAGVGDLVATCQSPLSRNRTFGENLGKGLTVEETIAITRQTCEAYKSCTPIAELARAHGVEMPITEQIVQVLHHGQSPRAIASAFMARDPRGESERRP
jgi:glycerol-3-phosphate dehydrogenase (NAD(P)+)